MKAKQILPYDMYAWKFMVESIQRFPAVLWVEVGSRYCRPQCRPWVFQGWHEVPTLKCLMWALFICGSNCHPTLHLSLTFNAEKFCSKERGFQLIYFERCSVEMWVGPNDVHFTSTKWSIVYFWKMWHNWFYRLLKDSLQRFNSFGYKVSDFCS